MKFSRDWLSDYVELPDSLDELCDRLTAVGLAIEGTEAAGEDVLLDVEVTPNRADCMNHIGLAREVASALARPLKRPAVSAAPEVSPEATESASVRIDDAEGCPRYAAVIVRGVRVGPSPEWLASRLESISVRPINNVVDVTNYVLWETGQPLHAFDLPTLDQASIIVRRAAEGERLVTLDGEERELDPEILVIADASRPVALAGIMGGADTEVSEATTDVLIESAHFSPTLVRKGARRLGMKTDASHRFERGSDPEACHDAALRAAELMVELAGGTIEGASVDARAKAIEPVSGRMTVAGVSGFGGVEIDREDAERWLTALGFDLQEEADGEWRITVPSWRTFDFELDEAGTVYPEYFYEEVLRHHGFDGIEATLPAVLEPDPGAGRSHALRERIRRYLGAAGLAETVTYTFYSREDDGRFAGLGAQAGATESMESLEPLELANALSDQYAVMRRSMLPNLHAGALFNQRRGAAAVRLFEIGHLFPGGEREEIESLGVIIGGELGSPWDRQRALDLFDLKGAVQGLAESRGLELAFEPAHGRGLVAGTASVVKAAGEAIGYLGQIDDAQIAYPLFAAEIATAPFSLGAVPQVESPSRFPGVSMDLTLTHGVATPWSEIASAVREARAAELQDFRLKDRYLGKGVPDGAVNTTIAFRYGAEDRSLTQEEVNERHAELTRLLEEKFAWRS